MLNVADSCLSAEDYIFHFAVLRYTGLNVPYAWFKQLSGVKKRMNFLNENFFPLAGNISSDK
jgi:hypothetical protein